MLDEPEWTEQERNLAIAYERLRPRYSQWTGKLKRLLGEMLQAASVDYSIEGRAKTVASLVEKAFRPGKAYPDPLTEISDLAGVRVVLRTIGDLSRVRAILIAEFQIDADRSIDKANELNVNQFGYRGEHYTVRLKEPRSTQIEYRGVAQLSAEIQVRTALQDAWDRVSHSLLYKKTTDVPRELQRRFHALAAVFELADGELNEILLRNQQIIAERTNEIAAGHQNMPLDVSSLQAYIQGSPTVSYWLAAAVDAGGAIKHNAGDSERYSANIAHYLGLATIEDLDSRLQSAKGWGERFLRAEVDRRRLTGRPSTFSSDSVVLIMLIAYFAEQLTPDVLAKEFGLSGADETLTLARQFANNSL